MDKLTVDNSFWQLFPDAQVNMLYVDGIDNHDNNVNLNERKKLLNQATQHAQQFLTNDTFRLNPVVDQWRKAYQQFKKKKGARSSIEALLKRVSQGREFSPIDPMVDIYNSVSLSYGVPVGMEDRDHIVGDMHLGQVQEPLAFQPVGREEEEPTLPGEVCYYDDQGAVCRCLNWRDGQRTMLTPESKNVIAVIEAVNPEQAQRADEAMTQLAKLIQQFFHVEPSQVFTLTKDHPNAII